jgi:hypothetical protein
MLDHIKSKFATRENEWEQDFARELMKYSKESLMMMTSTPGDQKRISGSVLDKLNDSLADEGCTPDDVKNILIRDREDRERNEMLKSYHTLRNLKRLSLQQMNFIKEEFCKVGANRDVKMLDRVLKDLKFFRRFD